MIKTRKPLEAEIQKACLQIFGAYGWRAFRRNTGAMAGEYKGKKRFVRFAEKGQADIYGWIPERGLGYAWPFECEVKRPGGKLSKAQEAWLIQCHEQGVIAFWVDSVEKCLEVAKHIYNGGHIEFIGQGANYHLAGGSNESSQNGRYHGRDGRPDPASRERRDT